MEKLVFLILFFPLTLLAVELKYLGKQEINANAKFDGHIVGGLSQVQFKSDKMSISDLPQGVYFIKIMNKNQLERIKSLRLVKQ